MTPQHRGPSRARVARRRQRGASLLAVVIWTMVLVFGALALSRSIVTSSKQQQANEETAQAYESATQRIEILRSETFAEVFARYNAVTSDNPGTGLSPGANFVVAGLQAVPGDADGRAGEVLFPVSTSNGARLSEQAAGFPGFPRDLNLDGDTLDAALTTSPILPVVVRVRWRSADGGSRTAEVSTTLGAP